LLPVLLFVTIATADLDGVEAGAYLAAAVTGFLLMAMIAILLRPSLKTDDPTFTSVFQGAVRWNGFVIFALAQAVFTAEQSALVAIVFGPTVPIINVMCVAALSVWGSHGERVGFDRVMRRIATNPLIIGCVIGGLGSVIPLLRLPLIVDTAELIGRAALPLILLTVGAGLDFSAIGAKPRMLAMAVALKLLLAPLIFISCGEMFGLDRGTVLVLAAVGAAPGAASSYVLAKELGGNAELTAGHVTVTTVLSFLTLPLWIGLVGSMPG
ncbi:MAG: AEC family transporter, partial [Parvularcula sp.]|nr:AEC family transporter [Parvularcula sp.]